MGDPLAVGAIDDDSLIVDVERGGQAARVALLVHCYATCSLAFPLSGKFELMVRLILKHGQRGGLLVLPFHVWGHRSIELDILGLKYLAAVD